MMNSRRRWLTVGLSALVTVRVAAAGADFDGRPWHLSTGNLSVSFIQASPIGAYPRPNVLEPPPPVASLVKLRQQGLVAYEDYVAWGAVERAPGQWDWTQHDRVWAAVKQAGLQYVVYDWVHFPPVWLRHDPHATLMRCVEHQQDTNYLSIFDPHTLDYYDHFYRALAQHFGSRIDAVYACVLGPYGEGNYPLRVPDWVDMGHCHEGYWCADRYALASFRQAMQRKYHSVRRLNRAWGTVLTEFSQVQPPHEISEGRKITSGLWQSAPDRRRWLDFITWYHQAIIDFSAQSVRVVLRYFPRDKVRLKPGGNAGGVNPIAWGTYCPGYARKLAPYGIVLQPADCQGAYFGDKWVATAYHYYGVRLATEPAGGLDRPTFVRRLFSDASCGAAQLFTYEFEQHVPEIQRYAHLVTGKSGDTQIAVLCPTTLYRLGGDLGPTIRAATQLRDLTDYDVLDELLIADGALTRRYCTLLMLQPGWVEQPILARIDQWVRGGGTLVVAGPSPVRTVEGATWPLAALTAPMSSRRFGRGVVVRVPAPNAPGWDDSLQPYLRGCIGYDGVRDGVWTTRHGHQTLLLHTTDKPVTVDARPPVGASVEVAPHTIAVVP